MTADFDISRRKLLRLSSPVALLLAGCSSDGTTESTTTPATTHTPTRATATRDGTTETTSARTTPTTTAAERDSGITTETESTRRPTTEPEPYLETISISIEDGHGTLPAAWTDDHSVGDYDTVLSLNAESKYHDLVNLDLDIEQASTDKELGEWRVKERRFDKTMTIGVTEFRPGDNPLEFKSIFFDETDTVTVSIRTEYLLDLQPANQNNSDSPIFNTYSSTQELTHDKQEINLDQLETWHDNDWENMGKEHFTVNGEGDLVTEMSNSKSFQDIKDPKAGTLAARTPYPNADPNDTTSYGSFDYNKLADADSYFEGQAWIKPLMFNFEGKYDDGAISTEDENYAAFMQEAFDQHTSVDIHAWAFDLPEAPQSTHGNGLVWDEKQKELRILETITDPDTDGDGYPYEDKDAQQSPLVENSNYLKEGHDAYDAWWHPLRFDGTAPDSREQHLDFEDGKTNAYSLFWHMATGFQDMSWEYPDDTMDPHIALTTDYIVDVIRTLRNYQSNDIGFENLVQQSAACVKLWTQPGYYIIGGDLENPLYAQIQPDGSSYNLSHEKAEEASNTLSELWEDPDGTIDEYVDGLTTENVDALLDA